MPIDWATDVGAITAIVIVVIFFLKSNNKQHKSFMEYQVANRKHIDLVSEQCHINQKDQADAVRTLAEAHRNTGIEIAKELKEVSICLGQVTERLRIMNGKREQMMKHLQKLEIDTGIHFLPVHKHSFFTKSKTDDMSVTNKVGEEIITLPLHSHMKKDFIERVIDGIVSFLK